MYVAVISTLSLILALITFRTGGYRVNLSWEYTKTDRTLSVTILNTGRTGVMISKVELCIVHRYSKTAYGPKGTSSVVTHEQHLLTIPNELWCAENINIPFRLGSNSEASISIK